MMMVAGASCASEEPGTGTAGEEADAENVVDGVPGEVVLEIGTGGWENIAGGGETRADVSNSSFSNTHHVREIWLYIFGGTGQDATCLYTEQVPYWSDLYPVETEPQTGYTPSEGLHEHRLTSKLAAATTYRIVAVGIDNFTDGSGTTAESNKDNPYGLPKSITVNKTTYKEAIAKLADTKTQADIANSELFGGECVVTTSQVGAVFAHIDLYRRFAGVEVWLKNIPKTIYAKVDHSDDGVDNGAWEDATVDHVNVECYTALNGSVALAPIVGTDIYTYSDFVYNPLKEQGDVLHGDGHYLNMILSISINHDTEHESSSLAQGTYPPREAHTYILPVAAPHSDFRQSTLRLMFYDKDGHILRSNMILEANPESGLGNESARYPLRANHVYSIGSKERPIDLRSHADEIIVIGAWQEDVEITI